MSISDDIISLVPCLELKAQIWWSHKVCESGWGWRRYGLRSRGVKCSSSTVAVDQERGLRQFRYRGIGWFCFCFVFVCFFNAGQIGLHYCSAEGNMSNIRRQQQEQKRQILIRLDSPERQISSACVSQLWSKIDRIVENISRRIHWTIMKGLGLGRQFSKNPQLLQDDDQAISEAVRWNRFFLKSRSGTTQL